MIAIVRIALSRPYTFIVTALLILIFGVLSALDTPTDILPNIGIRVVAVVWSYNGMSPDDMSGRVVYYYERTLSAMVNDIAHIESQSMFGYGLVKIFFQPGVNINAALAQVGAASQTVLKQLPAGITPPQVLRATGLQRGRRRKGLLFSEEKEAKRLSPRSSMLRCAPEAGAGGKVKSFCFFFFRKRRVFFCN